MSSIKGTESKDLLFFSFSPTSLQVLKFLAKCRKKKKLFASWHGLQELTDARRVELKQQVDDYVKRHPVCSFCAEIHVTLIHCIVFITKVVQHIY
jgi:hypothetical protein